MKKQILYYSFAIIFIAGVYAGANRVSAQAEPMVGGYSETAVNDKDAKRAAAFAVKAQSATAHKTLLLVKIQKAEVQVVAGLNYRVCLEIRDKKGNKSTVTAVVYKNLKNRFSLTNWQSGGCTDL